MSLRLPNGSYTVTPGGFGPTQQQKQPTQQPTFGSPAQTSQQAWGQEQAAAKTSKSSGVDMSAYKPSQAQPLQQSQGTAYGAYAPQPPSTQVAGDPRGGYAAAPPDQRPPPFYAAPAQTPWGQSMDPYAERDAFIDQMNQQRMQRQIDFNNNSSFQPNTWGGSPTLDPRAAMQGSGLGYGAPSMNPQYGDSLIGRLNEQFGGGQYQPPAYERPPQVAGTTDFSNRTQQFNGDPGRPSTGYGRPFHPQPNPGYGYGLPRPEPSQAPATSYGTPPEMRGGIRTMEFRDRDKDGVDDRDQDGPGQPSYYHRPPPPGTPQQPLRPGEDRLKASIPETDYWGLDPRTHPPGAPRPPILRPADERPKGGRAQPVQPPSQGSPYGPSTGYLSDSEMQEMRSYNNNTATPDQRNRQNELIALRRSRADAAPEYRQRQSDLMAKRQAVDAYRSKEADHRQAYYDATRAQQDMNRRLGIGPTYNPSTNGSLYPKLKSKGMRKGGGGQMR